MVGIFQFASKSEMIGILSRTDTHNTVHKTHIYLHGRDLPLEPREKNLNKNAEHLLTTLNRSQMQQCWIKNMRQEPVTWLFSYRWQISNKCHHVVFCKYRTTFGLLSAALVMPQYQWWDAWLLQLWAKPSWWWFEILGELNMQNIQSEPTWREELSKHRHRLC